MGALNDWSTYDANMIANVIGFFITVVIISSILIKNKIVKVDTLFWIYGILIVLFWLGMFIYGGFKGMAETNYDYALQQDRHIQEISEFDSLAPIGTQIIKYYYNRDEYNSYQHKAIEAGYKAIDVSQKFNAGYSHGLIVLYEKIK